jgi:hypothetical protein
VGGYSSSGQNKNLPVEVRGVAIDIEQPGFGVHKVSSGWHLHILGGNLEVSLRSLQSQLVARPLLRRVGKGGIIVLPVGCLSPRWVRSPLVEP